MAFSAAAPRQYHYDVVSGHLHFKPVEVAVAVVVEVVDTA